MDLGIIGGPLGWVMYIIYGFVKNYGVSLILFILLTRVVLFPLSIKQQITTSKTASLQPKLKELQKKYAKDKQKYQSEQMKLYEQEGVNPTAGCLPMLVQMILLFGIIDVIYNPLKHLLRIPADVIKKAADVIGKTSGYQIKIMKAIQDGSDKYNEIFGSETIGQIQNFDMKFLGLDLGLVPQEVFKQNAWLIIIPVLSGLTALMTTIVSTKQQARHGQQMQGPMKMMMYFMPLISVWFAFTLPAGVGFYWTIANIFTLGQTLILGRIYTPERLALENNKNKEKNREKIKRKREKLETYNKQMNARGLKPIIGTAPQNDEDEDASGLSEKEIAKKRLADARRRAAEKYGEEYIEE